MKRTSTNHMRKKKLALSMLYHVLQLSFGFPFKQQMLHTTSPELMWEEFFSKCCANLLPAHIPMMNRLVIEVTRF